ncbi:metallophosphoesterase [Candidatus Micrarchaeota archaeon]|nr:metallophosphoesterase [Candidatus Micrarchaeota archaeon]
MKFLYSKPAVLYKDAFIVGDTHFGIEKRLSEKGINLNFSRILAEKLVSDAKTTTAGKIIVLGDFKDEIMTVGKEAEEAIDLITKDFELIIVKGNHDGGIERLGIKVVPPEGFVYRGLGLIHGHCWPSEKVMNSKRILMAHQHPLYRHEDKFKKSVLEPVFISAEANPEKISKHYKKFNEKIGCIIMPAYNPLIGSVFNIKEKKLGPLFYNMLFKWNHINVYNTKGILLS